MSFPARVFRLLIASPSDVADEREIAVRTIQEWNDLNAAERQVVLLPLRWETHSAPEYGRRPQEVINRQIVDHCDLLIGIFWTRVGSPTGVADSGTIEEIERVATAGKPVMLYFSQAKQDPDKIELEQLARLREFKKKTFPNALIESYSGPVEFKDKLSRQVEIQLRSLLAAHAEDTLGASTAKPVTDIVLQFSDPETGTALGTDVTFATTFVDIQNFDQVPDHVAKSGERPADTDDAPGLPLRSALAPRVNRNYYRQQLTYNVLQDFFTPVRFWLQNKGAVGARDVYFDIKIGSTSGGVVLVTKNELPVAPPTKLDTTFASVWAKHHPSSPDDMLSRAANSWTTHLEVQALQPQREISPPPEILIGATNSCVVTISARVYADTLPEPVHQELTLRLNVEHVVVPADKIIASLTET